MCSLNVLKLNFQNTGSINGTLSMIHFENMERFRDRLDGHHSNLLDTCTGDTPEIMSLL